MKKPVNQHMISKHFYILMQLYQYFNKSCYKGIFIVISINCLYRVLAGKTEGKRPLGRPRHRWENNIKMDLQEVGCGYMDWTKLAQDRDRWRALMNVVMILRVP